MECERFIRRFAHLYSNLQNNKLLGKNQGLIIYLNVIEIECDLKMENCIINKFEIFNKISVLTLNI